STATIENRFRAGSSSGFGAAAMAISGAKAPTQYATQMPCRNTAGRVNHCGEADAAWPVAANESPTPAIANAPSRQATVLDATSNAARLAAMAAIATSSDGPRLVPSAAFQAANTQISLRARSSASIPCSPSDASALTIP